MQQTNFTTEQAAIFLGLKPNTLNVWRVQGRGPAYRKIGRNVRYVESDLAAFLESCKQTNTAQNKCAAKGAK